MTKVKISYFSDYPFSIGFGGKEIQMLTYLRYLNLYYKDEFEVNLLNYWSKYADYDILHLFGHGRFLHIIENVRNNNRKIKIVISPTLYINKSSIVLKSTFYLGSILPFKNTPKNIILELEHADAVIVNSYSEKSFLLKNITSKIDFKTHVIYNGIDDDFNELRDEDRNIFIKNFNLLPNSYILSVGMMDERKNTVNLLKAFLSVYHIIKKKLVIIGNFRFTNKSAFEEVSNLLTKNKDKIIHVEFIDKDKDLDMLKSAYYNCAYHLLPSYIETPGIANIEALYFGKNIVVGMCPPVKEYFGDIAIYCAPKDINSIANAILEADKMPYYNEKNVELVRDKYIYSKIVNQLVKVYNDVLSYEWVS